MTTRQSTVWVIVHVEDENDNPPTFPEVTYRISLTERDRNKRGEPVYRVFAYDRDLGANGNITYSITEGNGDEKFTIDPRTAMVSSKKMVTAGSSDVLTVSYALNNGTRLPLQLTRPRNYGNTANSCVGAAARTPWTCSLAPFPSN